MHVLCFTEQPLSLQSLCRLSLRGGLTRPQLAALPKSGILTPSLVDFVLGKEIAASVSQVKLKLRQVVVFPK